MIHSTEKYTNFQNMINSEEFEQFMNDNCEDKYNIFSDPYGGATFIDIVNGRFSIDGENITNAKNIQELLDLLRPICKHQGTLKTITDNIHRYMQMTNFVENEKRFSQETKKILERKDVADFLLKRFGESHSFGRCPICGDELWTDEDVSENKNGKLCHTACLSDEDKAAKNDDPPVCPVCKKYIFPHQRVGYDHGDRVHIDCWNYLHRN